MFDISIITLFTSLKLDVNLWQYLSAISNGFSNAGGRTAWAVGFFNWRMVLRSSSGAIHKYCTFLSVDVSGIITILSLSSK